MTDDAARVVETFLERSDIAFTRSGEGGWAFQLRGERKLTIPVQMVIARGSLVVESFFMRRPQENEAALYEMLLRRNARAYGVCFALDAQGDVYLIGRRPVAGLDEPEMDRLIGALLVEADGMFNAAIEVGFASYLATDLAWRARNAVAEPPN